LTKAIKNDPWSSRAKRGIWVFFLLWVITAAIGKSEPQRPKITGISDVRIRVTGYCRADDFYSHILSSRTKCPPGDTKVESVGGSMSLSSGQFITLNIHSFYSSALDQNNLLEEVGFLTDDAAALQQYLTGQGIEISEVGVHPPTFVVRDPAGRRIEFVQRSLPSKEERAHASPVSRYRIIHAGFIVRDLPAMNHFYRDILGFRPYWHGGMKDDETSWISLQVPDGTDWVEFMVNLPPDPDQHLRGVMNHIALGVVDIHATREQLVENGVHLTEEPKLGRDGKWQLNLYDPDQTRIEFMELTPKEKPCCSEFTGPHPQP
jgi:catechol 2,3-dioxygenase-like lactoylglutathione lyase family enzyme